MSPFGFRRLFSKRSNTISIGLFGVAVIATAALVMQPQTASSVQNVPAQQDQQNQQNRSSVKNAEQRPPQSAASDQVTLSGQLSQTKLVQGGASEVYMTVTINSPARSMAYPPYQGTDLVVVLDRSGSMSTPEKLPYAKKAVKELVALMGDSDRLALINFSDHAYVDFPLSNLTPSAKRRVASTIDRLSAGGGTNIYHGIETAWQLFQNDPSARMRKVVLLSDGEATSGDTSISGLRHVASLSKQREAILSTIGMGLGFNEQVMSSMADHGMGNFSYLETLEQLGSILAQHFQDAQQTFATTSTLTLTLPDGVQLVDAAGYPTQQNGGRLSITTGGLLAGGAKQFTLTLNVANGKVGQYDLSDIALEYHVNGARSTVPLPEAHLQVAVIEAERKAEAMATIDKRIYSSAWQENNIGRMRYSVNEHLRKGEKHKAKAVVEQYRQQVQAVEAESGIALYDDVSKELDVIDADLEEAFTGSRSEQKVKQNRLMKKSHADSLKSQRKMEY